MNEYSIETRHSASLEPRRQVSIRNHVECFRVRILLVVQFLASFR